VRELTSHALLEEHCLGPDGAGAASLCVIGFLPHILDSGAKGRNDYIKVLTTVADKFKDRPFSYFWVEGAKQPGLEASLEVGGYGYPALIALNPSKLKYATLKSGFAVPSLKEFIEGLRAGHERSIGISNGALGAVETTTPWDGKDAVVEEEEEFSLDDIMKEEL
jgi:protein disulfide-isomerase A6